jgi:hypothetical protein
MDEFRSVVDMEEANFSPQNFSVAVWNLVNKKGASPHDFMRNKVMKWELSSMKRI